MKTISLVIFKLLLLVSLVFITCEYLVYFPSELSCKWPLANSERQVLNDDPLYAIFLSSHTHLLGERLGHWFDKLRREWQMQRSFQTAMSLFRPDAVFILGDIADEGKWETDKQFSSTMGRFQKMFSVPDHTRLFVVAGNHDIGFHDSVHWSRLFRFQEHFDLKSVKVVSIKDIVWVSSCLSCWTAWHSTETAAPCAPMRTSSWGRCRSRLTAPSTDRRQEGTIGETEKFARVMKSSPAPIQSFYSIFHCTESLISSAKDLTLLQMKKSWSNIKWRKMCSPKRHQRCNCPCFNQGWSWADTPTTPATWCTGGSLRRSACLRLAGETETIQASFLQQSLKMIFYGRSVFLPEESTVYRLYSFGAVVIIIWLMWQLIQCRRGPVKRKHPWSEILLFESQ